MALCGHCSDKEYIIDGIYAIYTYDSSGNEIFNSTVLLFDTNVSFFHAEHIFHAALALSVIFIFVLPPPLLLLFYPTRFFRNLPSCCGFKRWDVLNFTMDIFQGWYKDGTDTTQDYRSVSALYILLRLLIGSVLFAVVMNSNNDNNISNWQIIRIFSCLSGNIFPCVATIL